MDLHRSIYDTHDIQIPCQFACRSEIELEESVHLDDYGRLYMGHAPALRRQLIALNSGRELARDSICKLTLRPREWMNSALPASALAPLMRISSADMEEALRLIRHADRLADRELRRAARSGARILTILDPDYPASMSDLELPPPVLYCRGEIPSGPAIAIVGSRAATPQGLEAAELFGRGLAEQGVTVVSGFARGIDLAAHRGAVSVAEGRTLAVLGCGLDVDYPRGRGRIRRRLLTQGALITEFPMGSQPLRRNFPIRNRLIAALSLGTLVVQGTPRSGSLITSRLALDLGRDVFAVPGSIFERRAAGPNALIQDGALLVTHPSEIVESLPLAVRDALTAGAKSDRPDPIEGPAGKILAAMPAGRAVTAEQLAGSTATGLDLVLSSLLELEMDGRIRRFPGPVFRRKP